jgi:hypothetical protein
MCTFRRYVDMGLYDMWEEVCSLAVSLELTNEEDVLFPFFIYNIIN